MSQNLLVERLKYAKRELTALKTAHRRGLGLLKIYYSEYDYTTAGVETGAYDIVATIKFDRKFGAFPFFEIVGVIRNWSSSNIRSVDIEQIRYTDDGYTVVCEGSAIYISSTEMDKFVVYSTAPVSSISCVWSS